MTTGGVLSPKAQRAVSAPPLGWKDLPPSKLIDAATAEDVAQPRYGPDASAIGGSAIDPGPPPPSRPKTPPTPFVSSGTRLSANEGNQTQRPLAPTDGRTHALR